MTDVLFCGIELAERIEHAEAKLIAAGVDAALRRPRRRWLARHGWVAQLVGAATAPAHRRRGVQSALLRAGLADAAEAGCDIAVVTTAPGSKSQQNVQRQGFHLLYTRAILVKDTE